MVGTELTHEAEEVYGTSEMSFDQDTSTETTSEGETTEETTETTETTTTETSGEVTKPSLTIPTGEGEETTEESTEETKEPEEAEAKGDFDVTAVEEEFYANNGEVSQETLESLYKQFPKNLVDNYMANAKAAYTAAITATQNEVFGLVGGEAQYGELMKWAGKNLSTEEVTAFNNVMAGTDLGAMKLAVKGIAAQAGAGQVKAPTLITSGKASATPDVEVFESQAQYVEAISDPRYEKDEAYRGSVRAKLALTKKYGGYKK